MSFNRVHSWRGGVANTPSHLIFTYPTRSSTPYTDATSRLPRLRFHLRLRLLLHLRLRLLLRLLRQAAIFHASNAVNFQIGIFPYMMLATLVLFTEPSEIRYILHTVSRVSLCFCCSSCSNGCRRGRASVTTVRGAEGGAQKKDDDKEDIGGYGSHGRTHTTHTKPQRRTGVHHTTDAGVLRERRRVVAPFSVGSADSPASPASAASAYSPSSPSSLSLPSSPSSPHRVSCRSRIMLAAYAAYVMVQAGLPFRHLWLNGGRWDAVNWTAQVRYWNDTSERMNVNGRYFLLHRILHCQLE